MTKLGEYLTKKAINRAAVSRKTSISAARLSELSNNESARLTAEELYLIALAIEVDPGSLLKQIYGHLALSQE